MLEFVGGIGCCKTTSGSGDENGDDKCLNVTGGGSWLELFDDRRSKHCDAVDCDSGAAGDGTALIILA